MGFDRKLMAKNLQILAKTPREIERQQIVFREAMAQIKADEASGDWSRNGIEQRKQKVIAERNKTCNALAKQMRSALEYVAANNNYRDSEILDFNDGKLQNALRTVEYMGKSLSYADQAGILNAFRGNVGALRILEKAFDKNGLYLKTAAAEMQKPLSERAINEMAEVLAFQAYSEAKGEWNFPIERAAWTKGEFQKQIDRLGLEDNTANPYSAIIEGLADSVSAMLDNPDTFAGMSESEKETARAAAKARLFKLKYAQNEINAAQERGENPAPILNRELAKVEQE